MTANQRMLLQAVRVIVRIGKDSGLICPYTLGNYYNPNCDSCPSEPAGVPIPKRVRCWLDYFWERKSMPTCERCGCMEDLACETEDGPCSWVSDERGLCSACAPSPADALNTLNTLGSGVLG